MPQKHAFLAMELALMAEKNAQRISELDPSDQLTERQAYRITATPLSRTHSSAGADRRSPSRCLIPM
jgi:hypothetical protein